MEEKTKDLAISQENPVKDVSEGQVLDQDEYRLAQLGYKQGEQLLCKIPTLAGRLLSLTHILI